MDYRKEKKDIYLRLDKGEELIASIKEVCLKERIEGGCFWGIGACDKVVLASWIIEKEDFIYHTLNGMLELINLTGNISIDKFNQPFVHCHAAFSYLNDQGEIVLSAGNLEEAHISYTGEIIISPAEEKIERMFDSKAGIEVWKLF